MINYLFFPIGELRFRDVYIAGLSVAWNGLSSRVDLCDL